MSMATILIVDDNPINLKLAASVLEDAGHIVFEARDAEEALGVIARTPPDLILMDVGLPGMDGLELTRRLKADPATRHIGIVAFTAFAMVGDEEKTRQAGCDDYISKPIDTRKFASQIADIVERLAAKKEGKQ